MDRKIAIIGGSNLFESEVVRQAQHESIRTPYGPVTAYYTGKAMLIQRHGIQNDPPHKINHKANLSAVKMRNIGRVFAINSVGSLKHEIAPGTCCIVRDFISFYNIPTIDTDNRIHITPAMSREISDKVSQCGSCELTEVVYWQTTGPRFETPAEIRMMANFADVVGMTLGSEATIACELGLEYASVCMVDNYANGIAPNLLDFDVFNKLVEQNQVKMDNFLEELLQCLC
ncbi:MAG: MTAP family purine nucleoside phosphorylase [Holophagae bacterium]|nr:MTAP family purine nucleoside phosphorylase [Holophagae bacterium]